MPKKAIIAITKSDWGGAQHYVFDIAVGAKEAGFDVSVLCGGNGRLVSKLKEENIRVIALPLFGRNISWYKDFLSLLFIIKTVWKERPDVFHINSAKMGGAGIFSGRLCGIKNIVFTAHSWAFNESRPAWQKFLVKFFSWLTVLFAHKTICVSEAIRNDIQNWPGIKNKMVVIHNGTSKINFKTKDEARKFLLPDAPSGIFWIGTISELHHIKGLTYAIRAMKSIAQKHNVVFVVIGEGEERSKLEKLIYEEGLEGKVFLKGFVQNAPEYLKAFDLFTLTSLSEAFALVLLEAGLAQLPIVATNVGGIPELINSPSVGALVESKNIIDIYKTIDRLIENKKERDEMAKNILERVSNEFTLEQTIKKTISVYGLN
jgi:glycosyltransferase involved in cell wall biosynthesis